MLFLIDSDSCDFNKSLEIHITGFVLARNEYFNQYNDLSQYELIRQLYLKYNEDFIKYVKGNFIIIINEVDKILIFNDFHSMKKFFFYQSGNRIIVSNKINNIRHRVSVNLNKIYPAILALFQRPVNGITLYEKIYYSQNATKIKITKSKNEITNYWCPIKFYDSINPKKNDINSVKSIFIKSIENLIKYNSGNISCTLTGGRDTRTVLSALLKLGVRPNVFTFGLPTGRDVEVSKDISKRLNLNFSNYFIQSLDEKKYLNLVEKIISYNDPFINTHRAHRLDAVLKDKSNNNTNILFTGFMGGDYTKGVSFNDYIVTNFMKKYFFSNEQTENLIIQILNENHIKHDSSIISELLTLLENIDFLNQSEFKKNEFLIAFQFIGSLHDYQDINVFDNQDLIAYSPFMDIDIFESLFNSKYSLLNCKRESKNLFNKLKGGELQAFLINEFYPELSKIPLSNGYKPIDILGNRFIYLFKRIFLEITKEKSNKSTFKYDSWMKSFIKYHYKNQETKEFISEYYDFKTLFNSVEANTSLVEGAWHKFTNPLNFYFYAKKSI